MFKFLKQTFWIVAFTLIILNSYVKYRIEKNEYQYILATQQDSQSVAEARNSVVTIFNDNGGQGSGFVVSTNGLVITNAHVVSNASNVSVVSFDKKKFEGNVVFKDLSRDVAVILVQNISLQPLKIRKDQLEIGEDVFAIGSPSGIYGTVTKGVVSNFIQMDGEIWIQGDAAINPGNSGGPLVDGNGNVVGISTMYQKDTQGIFFYSPIMDALVRLKLRERKNVVWYRIGTWYRLFL